MAATKKHRHTPTRIDIEKVEDTGTGFLGRRNYQGTLQPPDWQARLLTRRQIQAPLANLMQARQACRPGAPNGQVRDFLTVCCLYLAELSAEHARTPQRVPKHLPKGNGRKLTPFLSPEIEQLKQMMQDTASRRLQDGLARIVALPRATPLERLLGGRGCHFGT